MRAHGTARKVILASATAPLLALVAGPGVADAGTDAALGSACPANASVSIAYTPSGPDGGYQVHGSVTTLSNCRAEAEVLVTPEPSGDTPAFVIFDSRTSGPVGGVEGGLARLGDGVGVTFYIQSYDLGGDVSNRTAACTTYVGGTCGV
jgi:hypothetical protein